MNYRTIFKTALIGLFGSLARYVAFMDQHPSYETRAWNHAESAESTGQTANDAAADWFCYRVMPQLADDARTRRAQARYYTPQHLPDATRQKSFFDA